MAGYMSADDMAGADKIGRSAYGRLGLPSWRLSRTVCFYDRQSVSVTVCDRQSVTVCFCHRLSVSVIYSLFLLQTVCVCHRQTKSVKVSFCLSHNCHL